ncbi:MAG: TIGR04438 family Trp-rich protein [Burkholderiales bacterium]|nr:MAG: TIGR04438 family Trp-rich protein [Burkholderiales bacterium]
MWFVAIGVAMLVMNLAGIGPIGEWKWGWGEKGLLVLLPFGLAMVWWFWSDWSGLTKRKAMKKIDDKRDARRQKSLDALGLQSPKKGKR